MNRESLTENVKIPGPEKTTGGQAADWSDSEGLLQQILSTTKTAIFWKDAERRFRGANQAFLDYYGFASIHDILGKTDEDMG